MGYKNRLDSTLYQREWYARNKEKVLARLRKRRRLNPEIDVANRKRYRWNLKISVLSNYSVDKSHPACVCCGESGVYFLSIDHINNDGASHRAANNFSGLRFYQWLRKSKYPNGFQTLCHNCNMGKSTSGLGICPHKSDTITLRSEPLKSAIPLKGKVDAVTAP